MHATICLYLMMVGGPVLPPLQESDIVSVPLMNDQFANQAAADKVAEWEYKQHSKKLPHVPTMIDETQTTGGPYNRYGQRRISMPADPNAPRNQPAMPLPPTEGGDGTTGNRTMGPMPAVPGSGLGQSYSPNRSTAYDPNNNFGQRAVGGGAWTGTQTSAPRAYGMPTVGNAISNSTAGQYQSYVNSLAPNPYSNPSVGGEAKPFQDYQRPTGYSPWMSLYNTPTNNGTISTYTSTVQPQIQQQQFNSQVVEQIRGVQNQIRAPLQGGGSHEMPVSSGAGLTDPNAYINNSYMGPAR